jgi:uncharacterized protein (TIGR00369 family)
MSAEEIRARWEEELKAVVGRMRAGGGRPGIADASLIASKTGLERLQGLLSGEVPYAPIADTFGFALIEIAAGRAVFQGTPQFAHYNPNGTVHGGWYATLLDSAVGCAVQSTLPAGRVYVTVELGMNIVRAASHETGPLRAIAHVVHSGRQLATAEGRIVGPDERLYATATTTCIVSEIARRPA